MLKKMLVLAVVFMSLCISKANTADNFPKKENYMILVEKEKDKKAYADLAYLKSARFNVELVSLADIGIDYKRNDSYIRDELREYLISRAGIDENYEKTKNPIKYLLLDDAIPSGFAETIDGAGCWSDYLYAFLQRKFYGSDIELIINRQEFPEIIVSRMDQKQLKYWNFETKARRSTEMHTILANPIVSFYQKGHTPDGCPVTVMNNDYSYYGDYIRDVFKKQKINSTTLYETRYSKLSPEVIKQIKPIKKPDFPLNSTNFKNTLINSNLVLLGNTVERVRIAEYLYVNVYRSDFKTSIWNDKNKNYLADDDAEVTIEQIMPFREMNKDNLKRFYFVPNHGAKVIDFDFPISIRPKFDYHDVPKEDTYVWYQEGYDPEGSCILTVWNGILREIAAGQPFALANLKGYRNYAVYIKGKEDKNEQATNALRLFCYGPPDETINDLVQQPYLKADDVVFESISDKQNIVVENLGDKDLQFKITGCSNNVSIVQKLNQTIAVKPMQKFEIEFKRETPIGFLQNLRKIKFNTGWVYIESNDSFWKTKRIKISW